MSVQAIANRPSPSSTGLDAAASAFAATQVASIPGGPPRAEARAAAQQVATVLSLYGPGDARDTARSYADEWKRSRGKLDQMDRELVRLAGDRSAPKLVRTGASMLREAIRQAR